MVNRVRSELSIGDPLHSASLGLRSGPGHQKGLLLLNLSQKLVLQLNPLASCILGSETSSEEKSVIFIGLLP